MTIYRKNEQKNGLELVFDGVPAESIREEIKAAGFRWYRPGAYWYAKNTPERLELCERLADKCGDAIPSHKQAPAIPSHKQYEPNRALIEEAGNIYGDPGYYKKEVFDAVQLDDRRIVCIWKKHIKTDFCFGEHGYDFDEVVQKERDSRCFEYFERENLEPIKKELAELDKINGDSVVAVAFGNGCTDGTEKIACYTVWDANRAPWNGSDIFTEKQDARTLTAEEVEKIRKVLKAQLENMRKRCRIWWKKNGAEGLKTWTYWADA